MSEITWILSRVGKKGQALYVSERKGDGGVGWGYTQDIEKAAPLSTYWKRKFISDMRFVCARDPKAIEYKGD